MVRRPPAVCRTERFNRWWPMSECDTTKGGTERSKTPTHECVYCGEEFTFIGNHHREQHPTKRYDPVWYMDDSERSNRSRVADTGSSGGEGQ
jgi:hypothetical protein